MPDAEKQRAFALEVAQKLRAAGFEALWAGGCVRDQLLGLTPKDYDVATNALPDQIRALFGRQRTIPIGASFGVITVLGPRAAGQIEVATFRTDAAYSDGRHPDSVHFTTAEHDAERRDFTINGLFYDPIAEQVVDYVNGQQDLERGIIRAIGDPRKRLDEDKLRMLRAVRFAAAFNFTIDRATMQAIEEMAPQISMVSAERIGMEIRRMLVGEHRERAIQLLDESGLLAHILPEVAAEARNRESWWPASLQRLARLKQPTLPVAFAALLLFVSGADVDVIGRRLRFTNKEIERTRWLLENLSFIAEAPTLPWPRLQRTLIHEGIDELLALYESSSDDPLPAAQFCRERLAWPKEILDPPPLLDGGDLIRHGLEPGPHFARLLEQVRDAQLSGEIHSQDEAFALIDRLRN
jgi:tRNA nucleotidyltransferase/poly(A) polymerase